ncbi:MAG TPA: hypothetical protein VFY18_02750 [Candidatus Limnocylindrales bacterium]|nr:hypothetical protein [Candidatus Limnocylindrales bacterium]
MTRATILPMLHHRRAAGLGRPSHRPASILAALVLVVGACGTSAPTSPPVTVAPTTLVPGSPSASPTATGVATPVADPAALYRAIEDQVVAIRGLKPKAVVSPTVLDDVGIKKLITDSFSKDNPPAVMAANERIMKALGLLPADASLTDLYIDLLGSQVAGLYNPDDKKLYVVSKSGGIGATEKVTFSHEFTHALQDQNFDLGSLKLDEIGQGDRSFARLALVEGDATLVMSQWEIQHLSQAELGEILSASGDDESLRILLAMPPILRESLLFPYTMGLGFVQGLQIDGGWEAVNTTFANPPDSSEQILHPDKYVAHEKPVAVELPKTLASGLGSGWKVGLEDSFGEFQMQVWLKQNTTVPAATAIDAAAGWGGDRVAVVNGPNGAWAVVFRTAWDSDADATAFETVATPIVEKLADPAALVPGVGGRERWVLVASDPSVLQSLGSSLGLAG